MTRIPGRAPTRVRLFVLPHAGGGASAYRSWRSALPEDVELCLVHPPGREGRIGEPPLRSLDALVDDVAPAVAALAAPAGPSYVLFGHSMGSLVAWALARRLVAAGAPAPARLVVSAHRAPHVPDPRGALWKADDERLLAELERLGGTPPEVLAHPELMELVLPVFRADLEAAGRAGTGPPERLPCGVTVMAGRDDATVSPAALEAWREHAAPGDDGFRLRRFDGGHFYLGPEALAFLGEELHRATRAG